MADDNGGHGSKTLEEMLSHQADQPKELTKEEQVVALKETMRLHPLYAWRVRRPHRDHSDEVVMAQTFRITDGALLFVRYTLDEKEPSIAMVVFRVFAAGTWSDVEQEALPPTPVGRAN